MEIGIMKSIKNMFNKTKPIETNEEENSVLVEYLIKKRKQLSS